MRQTEAATHGRRAVIELREKILSGELQGGMRLFEVPIAELLDCDLVIYLIGERPGGDAQASRSLSAYLAYRGEAHDGKPTFEYSVISNIYQQGLPPAEAASVIVERAAAILRHRAAGNRLEALLHGAGETLS